MAEITSEGHTGSSGKKEGKKQLLHKRKAHKNLGVSDTHVKIHLEKQKQFSTTLGSMLLGRRMGLCQVSWGHCLGEHSLSLKLWMDELQTMKNYRTSFFFKQHSPVFQNDQPQPWVCWV